MRAIVNRYINYNYLHYRWSRKKIIQQPQLILYTRDYGRANALTNWLSKFFLISIPPTINDEKSTVQESIGWKEHVVWKPKGRKIASIGQYLGGVGGSPTRDGTKWRRNGSYYTLFRLDIADSYRNHPDHDVSLYENSFRTPVFHEFIKIRWSIVATGDTPDAFARIFFFSSFRCNYIWPYSRDTKGGNIHHEIRKPREPMIDIPIISDPAHPVFLSDHPWLLPFRY